MARNEERQRVLVVRAPYRTHRTRRVDRARDLLISARLSVGDLFERTPYALLEIGPARLEWQVELLALPRQVLLDLIGGIVGERRRRAGSLKFRRAEHELRDVRAITCDRNPTHRGRIDEVRSLTWHRWPPRAQVPRIPW